jgi:hypothetical protein
MRLDIKISSSIPRTEKVRLTAELVELLDNYVQFYQVEFSSALTAEKAILEMLYAFIKSDRSFQRWYRNQKNMFEDK